MSMSTQARSLTGCTASNNSHDVISESPSMMNGLQQSQPSDLVMNGYQTMVTSSNNSHNVISESPSMINGLQQSRPIDMVTNGYQTMVQPPATGQMTNSLQQFIQLSGMNHQTTIPPISSLGDGGKNIQLNTSDLMFNLSGGSQQFPGGAQMVSNGISNDRFTQLLPKIHPMKAVPVCVSALSHGAPRTSHHQELGSTLNGTTAGLNGNRVFTSFSPQASSMIQQQQLQCAHEISKNHSAPRLPHAGENMCLPQQPNLRQPQQLATVPKQKLSNLKSIVSIRQDHTESHEPAKVQCKENDQLYQTHNILGAQQPILLSTNQVQEPLTNHYLSDSTSVVSTITTKQMEERQQSSYSSACNATIMAQQKLSAEQQQQALCSKNGHINIEQDENDSKDQVNKSLVGGASALVNLPSAVYSLNNNSNNNTPGTGTKRNLDGGARATNNDIGTFESIKALTTTKLEPQHKYVQVVGGKVDAINLSTPLTSPHTYLQNLLASRGYSTKHYCSLEGGYYCRPTPLQCASYGNRIVNAARTSNTSLFSSLLAAGLSPNPCNKFGESILHMVCRRGDYDLLKLLLDSGSTIQVSDDFGRTPLHDACWTTKPCFKSIEMLLERDVRLLHIVDCRGSPPLEYVKKESWGEWIQFFDDMKEVFWPQRNVLEESEECPPQLVNVPPHSRPVPDPENCATLDDATMFSK